MKEKLLYNYDSLSKILKENPHLDNEFGYQALYEVLQMPIYRWDDIIKKATELMNERLFEYEFV